LLLFAATTQLLADFCYLSGYLSSSIRQFFLPTGSCRAPAAKEEQQRLAGQRSRVAG
jgi:hypothetical protein